MIKTIDPKGISPLEFYNLITDTVTPRPIAFVSSCDQHGNVNLSPFSFFNVFSANPPILVFSPLKRMRDNSTKHTLNNIMEHDEVVINLVSYNMVDQMSLASCDYPKDVNEFIKAGFTELKSEKIKPPRVKEAAVSFECKVKQTVPLGNQGGAGTLVICEIILAHIDTAILDAEGKPDPLKMDLVARLGRDWYSTVSKDTLFKVSKPRKIVGIGVDQIPEKIKNSTFLSGNQLGKLAIIESLPTSTEVLKYAQEHPNLKNKSDKEIHQMAIKKLAKENIDEAWMILLSGL